MCRFRDIWVSLGTEIQGGFHKSSDHTAWCVLLKSLPMVHCWKRSPLVSVVILEKQSPRISGMISVAEKWGADWQLSARSLSWASRCVDCLEKTELKHTGFVFASVHSELLLWGVWLSVEQVFSPWLTLTCYVRAFSWIAQCTSQQVKYAGTHQNPFSVPNSFRCSLASQLGALVFKHILNM